MTKASFKMRLSPVVALLAMFATEVAMLVAMFMIVPGLSARGDVGDNGTGANTSNIEIKYVMASAAKISFGVTKPQNLTYTLTDGTTVESNAITNSTSPSAQIVTSTTTWASGATVMLTISASGTGAASLEGFGSTTGDVVATSNQNMRRVISFGDFGITSLYAAFAKTPVDFAIYPDLPASVRSLQYAFAHSNGNPDISNWNVSRITSLYGTFSAAAFNRNLNSWDVSSVTDFTQAFGGTFSKFNNGNAIGAGGSMTWLQQGSHAASFSMRQMFYGNGAFNQNVSSWDVSKCNDFHSTFGQMAKFNNGQTSVGVGANPLSWDTSNASVFTSMFILTPAFNQDVSGLNLSKATSLDSMFESATVFNNGLSSGVPGTLSFNTSLVTNMTKMFKNAPAFNQDISGWDLGKVTGVSSMFESATSFNNGDAAGVSGTLNLNTSLVTNMSFMFKNASAFNQDISSWNLGNVSTTESMFESATSFNQNISGWNVAKVTTMQAMFRNASAFNQPLNGWNVASVQKMSSMFNKATSFNQPLNQWNTVSVTDLANMFDGATVFDQSLANFSVSKVSSLMSQFLGIFGSSATSTSGMSGANIDRTLVSWSYQRTSFGDFGAYGKPKWSTCAGYYAIQRITATFTGWTTPSSIPTGCSSQTVAWASNTVYLNSATPRKVAVSSAATTNSSSPVRYVIVGTTGLAGDSKCSVNYETGEFEFLVAYKNGTCTVRAFDTSETNDGSSSSYVDVNYVMQQAVYAPGLITATVISDTQINLTWSAPGSVGAGFVDYQIEYSADNGGTWTVFPHTASTTAAASITGLVGNTSYRFRVAVINAIGVNDYQTTGSLKTTKISAPTSVVANSFENGTVTVSWVAATQGSATTIKYLVQAQRSGVNQGNLCDIATSPCVITGLTNGVTYDIVITPRDQTLVNGVIYTPYPTATPSAGITSLATGTPTTTSVPLTWVQPVNGSNGTLSGITGYTVQYSTGDYSTWSDASTTVAAGTGYTVTGLTGNTNYKFRVRLNNPANSAPWVTTPTAVLTSPVVPSAPTSVAGTSDANGSSVITWTPGSNGGSAITGYKVEYSTDGSVWTTAVASTSSSPYTITGLTNGASYYVRVSGINSLGTGTAGVSVATFMPGAVPGAPTSVTATSSELGQSTVSWSAPASNGGRAITTYTVTSNPGAFTCSAVAPATSCVVTGLTYSNSYTFTVTATNSLGSSQSSAASNSITVGGLPTAPTVVSGQRAGTRFNAVVIPPSSNGGRVITSYEYRYKTVVGSSWSAWATAPTPTSVTLSNNQSALDFSVPGIPQAVPGQANWGAIQFRALNSAGAGQTSVQAPNVVDITIVGADNGQFTFAFDLTDDGNSPIVDFQYQILPNDTQTWSQWISMGVSSDAQPFTISGLTNGIGYGLRVRAENAYGFSSGFQSTFSTTPTGFPNKPLPTLSFTYPVVTTGFVANATFTPTFTNSGDGAISFASRNISVCTADPVTGVATIVSAGTCLVRLEVAEGTLHRPSAIEAQFEVTAAPQVPLAWNVSATSAPYMGSILLAVTGGNGSGLVTFAKSGTSTCSIIGSIVVLGEVGSVCSVTATKAASGGYSAVSTTTALLLTSTPIAQADVVPTFGLTAFVNQSVTLQATGGSGTGAYQYTVTNAGTTGCSVNQTTKVVTFTGAGSCVISTERAASTNYIASLAASKTIVVSRRTQSVTFTSLLPTLPLAGDTYQAAATSSSTLPVTFTISSGNCAVVNGEITFTGVGACAIAATQAGDNVFLPASATQTVVVGQRNQVLSFDSATNAISTKTFGGVGFLVRANSSESTAALVYSVSADTTNGACTVTTSGFVTIQAVGTCVIQVDSAGASTFTAASSISKSIGIVADLPGAPAIGSVSAGNMKATLGFFAPSYTGGSAITGYRVIAVDQAAGSTTEISDSSCGIVPVNSTITCVVSGLTNGSTYKFKVAAINEAGTGAFSALSAAITVATNPSAVRNLSVAEGNAALIISWSAPDSLGGGTFSAYRIFIKKSSEATYDQDHFFNVVNYNTSTVTVSLESPGDGMTFLGGPALRNGVAYDVKIVTVTTANLLELEANTALANQIPHTVPDAPLVASSVVVGSQLVLTWTAPLSDGGKPILGYSVIFQNSACTLANPNQTLCAVALPTAPGTYTFQVVATNEAGQSAPRTGTFYVSSGGSSEPVTKPFAPIVKSVSVATDGKSITILGSDLSDILSIAVGSIEAKIISQDGGTIVITATGIPAGVYDLMIAFKDGTKLREVGAITIAGAKPVTPAKFTARTVLGFAKGSALLSATQTRELKTYFEALRGTSAIECIGSTEGPSILKSDAKLAMKRSVFVCSLAKASGLKIKSISYVNQVKVGAKYRSVSLKVWKLPTK